MVFINLVTVQVDIIVGTPGRLDELIKSENILLTHCRFFVLDEADGLLQQGQGEIINRLHSRAPKITTDGKRLQMIVCSATLHSFEVKKMAVFNLRKCGNKQMF
jgi:ATP-dependent RNA helicase DDX1